MEQNVDISSVEMENTASDAPSTSTLTTPVNLKVDEDLRQMINDLSERKKSGSDDNIANDIIVDFSIGPVDEKIPATNVSETFGGPITSALAEKWSNKQRELANEFVEAVQENKIKRKQAAVAKKKVKNKEKKTNSVVRISTPIRRGYAREFSQEELEKFYEPLRNGWKRELCYRKTQLSSRSDVYYFDPKGLRLRSLPEVENHLNMLVGNTYTRANFTFRGMCLEFKEIPNAEYIKNAAFASDVLKQPEAPAATKRAASLSPAVAKKKQKLSTTNEASTSKTSAVPAPKKPVVSKTKASDKIAQPIIKKKSEKKKAKVPVFRLADLSKVDPAPSKTTASSPKTARNIPVATGSNGTSKYAQSTRMKALHKTALLHSRNRLIGSDSEKFEPYVASSTTAAPQSSPKAPKNTIPAQLRNKARKSICLPKNRFSGSAGRKQEARASDTSIAQTSHQQSHVDRANEKIVPCSVQACPEQGRIPTVPCRACLRLFHKVCVSAKGHLFNPLHFECNDCLDCKNNYKAGSSNAPEKSAVAESDSDDEEREELQVTDDISDLTSGAEEVARGDSGFMGENGGNSKTGCRRSKAL